MLRAHVVQLAERRNHCKPTRFRHSYVWHSPASQPPCPQPDGQPWPCIEHGWPCTSHGSSTPHGRGQGLKQRRQHLSGCDSSALGLRRSSHTSRISLRSGRSCPGLWWFRSHGCGSTAWARQYRSSPRSVQLRDRDRGALPGCSVEATVVRALFDWSTTITTCRSRFLRHPLACWTLPPAWAMVLMTRTCHCAAQAELALQTRL